MADELKKLPGADELALPNSTAVERIYAAYVAEEGSLERLSYADQLHHQQLQAAYGMLLNYNSVDQAWPMLAKQFGIGRATCYRRFKEALNLFGDIKKVKKEARRSILIEFARKVLTLAMEQRNLGKALAALKFEASLAGLTRADVAGDEAGTGGAVSTTYNIILQAPGRKPHTVNLNNLDDVSDADFTLIQDAVQQNVFGADQMNIMLTELSGKGGGSNAGS